MTDLIDSAGFRANVGIILLRPAADAGAEHSGELFIGGRPDGRGWQFPQGGMRRGETAEAALYRELGEEIGLKEQDVELLGSTRSWLRYRLPEQFRRRTQPLCIGQKQRWFLLRFRGEDAQFRFDTTDEEPEFETWRWVPYWAPVREVIHFKRQVYSRALHELAPLAFPHGGPPPYPQWWTEDLTPRRPLRRRRHNRSR
jgi:putative (di)nucleoside polyphosphate hydrolase